MAEEEGLIDQIPAIKAWIRLIRKDIRVDILDQLGIDSTGLSAELKSRLLQHIHPDKTEVVKKVLQIKKSYEKAQLDVLKPERSRVATFEPLPVRDESQEEESEVEESGDSEVERENTEKLPKCKKPSKKRLSEDETDSENEIKSREPCILRSKRAQLMEIVRKWSVKFSGDRSSCDAITFIERVEDLADSYGIPMNQLPRLMTELLKGESLDWYCNHKNDWSSWKQFKKSFLMFFVPFKRQTDYEDDVREYLQSSNQSMRQFILAMEIKMRRTPEMSRTARLDRIYSNLLTEYKRYFKRREFRTMEELMALGDEFELLNKEKRTPKPSNNSNNGMMRPRSHDNPGSLSLISSYDRNECCWRCGKRGHRRPDCKSRPVLFCSYCGQQNIKTIDCPCPKPQTFSRNNNPNYQQPRPSGSTNNNGSLVASLNPTVAEYQPVAGPSHQVGLLINDPRPFIDVKLQGRTFRGLVDSGATTCYIGKKVIDWLDSCGVSKVITATQTTLADGSRSSNQFSYMVPWFLNGIEICHPALTLESLTVDLVIGMSLLSRLGFQFSFQTQELLVENQLSCLDHDTSNTHEDEVVESSNNTSENSQVKQLLDTYIPKFEHVSKTTHLTEHIIRMIHDNPIKQRYYPRNPAMQKVINEEIDELVSNGQIEPSNSPYSSPIVLVRKKDNSWRLCIDYRQLNENSVRDAYPMPQIHYILDKLQGASYVSSIDLKSGYWQIPIKKNCRQYTAFTVPGRGLYQWKVMPFGLHSAPATFQRTLDSVINESMTTFAFAYLDDIIIFSPDFSTHLTHLTIVLEALLKANLRINVDKCNFCQKELKYLGHVVGDKGIHTDPDKVAAITQMATPTDVTAIRRFLGMVSYYRRFIENCSALCVPLTELTMKGQKFEWTDQRQKSFELLKEQLATAPILSCPDFTKTFYLQTDASNVGLGSVLFQRTDHSAIPIKTKTRRSGIKNPVNLNPVLPTEEPQTPRTRREDTPEEIAKKLQFQKELQDLDDLDFLDIMECDESMLEDRNEVN